MIVQRDSEAFITLGGGILGQAASSLLHFSSELRLYSGPGSLGSLARELDRTSCRRAALICSSSLARSPAIIDLIRTALGARLCGEFSGVRTHSPTSSVDEAARFLRESKADAVVAVGGGSVIVTARAASIVLAECRSVPEMCTYRAADGRFISPKLPEPKLPQFVLPTTPTSACVKAGSAVLDEETGRRMALFDPKTRARAIFLHPTLLQTPSVELALSSALNTLAMSVEGLESATSDPISDALLTHSLRILTEQLPRLQEKAMAPADREKLMFAAVLCGRGTDVAGGGLASVIGHTLGQRTQVANGYINAIVLPWTMQYNAPATSEGRLPLIADALRVAPSLGHETPPSAIGRVQALLDGLLIPRRLKDIGLSREELPQIAAAAMDDWFVERNPQPVRSACDVLTVLEAAW